MLVNTQRFFPEVIEKNPCKILLHLPKWPYVEKDCLRLGISDNATASLRLLQATVLCPGQEED